MSKQEITNHFFEFVKAVSRRPGMFLVNNVEDIGLVILGYKQACSFHSERYSCIDEIMHDFQKIINDHFNTTEDLAWVSLIRFHCVSNAATLDFFNLKFNEFASAFAGQQ